MHFDRPVRSIGGPYRNTFRPPSDPPLLMIVGIAAALIMLDPVLSRRAVRLHPSETVISDWGFSLKFIFSAKSPGWSRIKGPEAPMKMPENASLSKRGHYGYGKCLYSPHGAWMRHCPDREVAFALREACKERMGKYSVNMFEPPGQ